MPSSTALGKSKPNSWKDSPKPLLIELCPPNLLDIFLSLKEIPLPLLISGGTLGVKTIAPSLDVASSIMAQVQAATNLVTPKMSKPILTAVEELRAKKFERDTNDRIRWAAFNGRPVATAYIYTLQK